MSYGDIGVLIKGGLDEEAAEYLQRVLGSFEEMLKACKSDLVQEGVVAVLEKIAKSSDYCTISNVNIMQGGYKPQEGAPYDFIDEDDFVDADEPEEGE